MSIRRCRTGLTRSSRLWTRFQIFYRVPLFWRLFRAFFKATSCPCGGGKNLSKSCLQPNGRMTNIGASSACRNTLHNFLLYSCRYIGAYSLSVRPGYTLYYGAVRLTTACFVQRALNGGIGFAGKKIQFLVPFCVISA